MREGDDDRGEGERLRQRVATSRSAMPPAPKNGATPGWPITISSSRLVALPSRRKPISTRVRLRSSIA